MIVPKRRHWDCESFSATDYCQSGYSHASLIVDFKIKSIARASVCVLSRVCNCNVLKYLSYAFILPSHYCQSKVHF